MPLVMTNELLRLDGVQYDIRALAPSARVLAERLTFVQQRLQELHNQQAMLTKARNAYITDLKTELLRPALATVPAAPAEPGAGGLAGFLRDDFDTF